MNIENCNIMTSVETGEIIINHMKRKNNNKIK